MARVYTDYSAGVDVGSGDKAKYRGYINYSTSQTDTAYTVTATCGVQGNRAVNVDFAVTLGATGYSTSSGTTYLSYSNNIKENDAYWNGVHGNKTYSYTRGHSAVTKTLTHTIINTNGAAAWKVTRTATLTVTVPAKPSYAVSYNANGGSGTISNQTKWYGENLTLESSGFTRANYTLKKWNTKADGTGTDYALGGTYTGNAALTLYAVWELNAVVTKTKVSGAWKSGILYVKVNGAWVIPYAGYVKVNGTWKQITKE